MRPKVKFRFNCVCTNDCLDFDMKEGMIFGGTINIDEHGDTTFVIEFPDGSTATCVKEWFANYFKIID